MISVVVQAQVPKYAAMGCKSHDGYSIWDISKPTSKVPKMMVPYPK